MSSSSSQCPQNPPTHPQATCGAGTVQEFGGLKTCVTGTLLDSRLAILLISDIFGYEAPLFRKLADKVAASRVRLFANHYWVTKSELTYKTGPGSHSNAWGNKKD